jgi:hypothetical protein
MPFSAKNAKIIIIIFSTSWPDMWHDIAPCVKPILIQALLDRVSFHGNY